ALAADPLQGNSQSGTRRDVAEGGGATLPALPLRGGSAQSRFRPHAGGMVRRNCPPAPGGGEAPDDGGCTRGGAPERGNRLGGGSRLRRGRGRILPARLPRRICRGSKGG